MADLAKAAAQAQPTAFHQLLMALSFCRILGRTYTQNIDGLELKAGLTTVGDKPNCVQLHGSVMEVRCTQCNFTEHAHHHFSALSSGQLPPCPRCEVWIESRKSKGKRIGPKGGLLRPSIILYGESHPKSEDIESMQFADRLKADNLLVVGTSLQTYGSVRLIKELSRDIRSRGGKAYYVNLTSPPVQHVKCFDYILRSDCQDLAHRALDRLKMAELAGSITVDCDGRMGGFADFADLVNRSKVRKDMRPSWDWA